MNILNNLLYTNDHDWVKVEGNKAYVGLTDYAQHALGSIVFVELPEIDDELAKGDTFGVVESVKAASDSYMPIGGKVLEINDEVVDNPEVLNEDPYKNWLICVEISDEKELKDLLDSDAYRELCSKEE
ncbi:glycine cleavage system protein GcvH [Haloimpatiens sp. FM7315]|uniref:glycine cleavage system protein GcvH n=1 Tax=Haloimpatiens sp. FM7315 TaxID=3298609 RepID=UPI0035A31BD7